MAPNMGFWKPKSKRKATDSSASDGGDSPISANSSQSVISGTGQPSHSINSAIRRTLSGSDAIRRPQPTPALDYQPPEYRGHPPPTTSSKGLYSMPDNYPDIYAQNTFDTYRFGTGTTSVTTMTDTDSQIDPLSTDEERPYPGTDTTPRPSLAISTPLVFPLVHPQPISPTSIAVQGDDPANVVALNSMASVSESSLAKSDAQSQTDTSQRDPSSDDDAPRVRYYGYPFHQYPSSSSLSSASNYYFNEDDLSDVDAEINSSRTDDIDGYSYESYESSDYPYWDTPSERDSFVAAYPNRTRGSDIMAAEAAEYGPFVGRERENSVATLRFSNTSRATSFHASLESSFHANLESPGPSDVITRQSIDNNIPTTSHPPITAIDYGIPPNVVAPEPSASLEEPSPLSVEPAPKQENPALDFDMTEWGNIAEFGIKGGADLGVVDVDVVAANRPPDRKEKIWNIFGAGAIDAARRPSVTETINDTFHKHALTYKDGQDWSFRKENIGDSEPPKKRRPIFIPFSERPARGAPPWKGMALGTTELWRNDISGIFKVDRVEIVTTESRPTQQRLSIHHLGEGARDPTQPILDPHSGPTATVHKHSKAAAFSLSRHYRDKNKSKGNERRTQPHMQPLRNAVYTNPKKTAMILLAPRKVQKAYTSTTTTRRLEDYGALNDNNKNDSSTKWKKYVEEEDRLKEKRLQKEQAKREKQKGKGKGKEKTIQDKGKGKAVDQGLSQTEAQLAGLDITSPAPVPPSVDKPSVPLSPRLERPSTSSASDATAPVAQFSGVLPTNVASNNDNVASVVASPSNLVAPPLQFSASVTPSENTLITYERNHWESEEAEEDYDEEDAKIGLVTRRRRQTPHAEAYHSLSPESLDSIANYQEPASNRSFLSFLGGRNNNSNRTVGRYMDTPYNPPWLSAPSPQPNRQMPLSSSFQGVGLLPSEKEISYHRRKAIKHSQRDVRSERKYTKEVDVFADLPEEALYMIVPLWPSETDPVSSLEDPFEAPKPDINERLYALIYYKPHYAPEPPKSKKDKKKSRQSPGPGSDLYIDDRNVLMGQFYIGARIVAYEDLQGSNIRVPDTGLAVIGKLREAYESRPRNIPQPESKKKGKEKKRKEFWDYIIGTYSSRVHPIDFYPEGFKKMGLATQTEPEDDRPLAVYPKVPSSVRLGFAGPSTARRTSTASIANDGGIAIARTNTRSSVASTSSLASVPASTTSNNLDNNVAPPNDTEKTDKGPIIRKFPPREEDPIDEAPIVLTPLGRAVLELAFMGALAVTSFTPVHTPWY